LFHENTEDMTIVYPGSFDPVTLGHIDITRRAAEFAHRLVVAVLDNPHKEPMFSVAERVSFLQDSLADVSNVEIDSFSGLLADYVVKKGADAVLRGLRCADDFGNEFPYAVCNKAISGGRVETIFLPASPEFVHVSSSIVREVANFGVVSDFVPPVVRVAIEKRFLILTDSVDS